MTVARVAAKLHNGVFSRTSIVAIVLDDMRGTGLEGGRDYGNQRHGRTNDFDTKGPLETDLPVPFSGPVKQSGQAVEVHHYVRQV